MFLDFTFFFFSLLFSTNLILLSTQEKKFGKYYNSISLSQILIPTLLLHTCNRNSGCIGHGVDKSPNLIFQHGTLVCTPSQVNLIRLRHG